MRWRCRTCSMPAECRSPGAADIGRSGHGTSGITTAAASEGSGFEASATGQYRQWPVQLSLHADAAQPLLQQATSSAAAPWVPLRVQGRIGDTRLHFDGKAAALLSARLLEGALDVAGPSLAALGGPFGMTLPRTPPFALQGRLGHEGGGVWRLLTRQASIGGSLLAGDFRYDPRRHPATLSGRLTGARLVLSDLGPAVGTSGERVAAGGRVLPRREFDLRALRGMDRTRPRRSHRPLRRMSRMSRTGRMNRSG